MTAAPREPTPSCAFDRQGYERKVQRREDRRMIDEREWGRVDVATPSMADGLLQREIPHTWTPYEMNLNESR